MLPYILLTIYLCGLFFFIPYTWTRFKPLFAYRYDKSDYGAAIIFASIGWPIYFPWAAVYRYFNHTPQAK